MLIESHQINSDLSHLCYMKKEQVWVHFIPENEIHNM